jgi:hypothetical protein
MRGPAAAARDDSRPADTRLNSLAMGVLREHAGRRRDCRVLDVGPGLGPNVDFLSQFSSSIVFEDLYQTMAAIGQPFTGADRSYCPVFETLLPYRGQAAFDLVLLWDILDYLDADDIRRLARHLAALCRPGSLIYGLVGTGQKVSAMPTSFRILDKDSLLCRESTVAQRDCPRLTQVRLLELMRGFRVKRSFLLRSGRQEYLFEPG